MSEPELRTVELQYEGPPALVGALAQMLREDGMQVSYEPPMEQRDAALVIAIVTLVVQVTGADDRMKAAIDRFVERFKRAEPKVSIGGQASRAMPAASLTADLTELARLHAEGQLTDAEFAAAKAKLLA